MALRPFSTLTNLFPNLGPSGASAEAKVLGAPPYLATALVAEVAGYSPELKNAISFWTENNGKIVPFMSDEDRRGALDAFCTEFKTRRDYYKAQTNLTTSTASLEAIALRFAKKVKLSSDQLRQPRHSFSTPPAHIYRGEAIELRSVHATYRVGQIVTWDLPKSCTLNDNFVPLHFAWKQYHQNFRKVSMPAGILLEIELDPTKAASLLWAGWVTAPNPLYDMRWQQEIIVLPQFRFEVLSCMIVHTAGGPLYEVKAREIYGKRWSAIRTYVSPGLP
ncbi:hypothetical protein [Novosphingobium sp. AP12]|uniref:hypothetical protein n=1 Tax=Novosphingobium sp. AP12 TaxID=1144305 RepID=UPI000271F6B3|nr:hypothetical protein [Novosphingobium sp. AP12]EJL22926.1 hypothetical protein PMI02_04383 [Novosphingobium sp. AP12]